MGFSIDEINTCKSMGLISELICKHTCYGEKLSENIVFIAACNPYRESKSKKKHRNGLDINQAYFELKHLIAKEKKNIEKANL